MKPKKCKVCKVSFVPTKPLQAVCDFGCAIELNLINRQKKENKEKKEKNAEIRKARAAIKDKDRRAWLKEAQVAFNKWIRVRDRELPCISCNRFHGGQNHAGHYLPTSTRSSLRFHPDNVHLQCQPCNCHLHGNIVPYRQELLRRIGAERLEFLEGVHQSKYWSITELKEIKIKYTHLVKELDAAECDY